MHYKKKKRGGLRIFLVILLILVLVAGGVFAFLFFTGRLENLGLTPPEIGGNGRRLSAWYTDEEPRVLAVQPPPAGADEAAMRSYFSEAVAFAQYNDFNTLLFVGKTDLTVHWQDEQFPQSPGYADETGALPDPLQLLCEEADGRELQIWLGLDAYTSGGYTNAMEAPAALLASSRSGTNHTRFSPDDAEYAKLLESSLADVARNYPLAGVVLLNLNAPVAGDAAFGGAISATVENLRGAWHSAGLKTRLALSYNEAASLISPEDAAGLVQSGRVEYLLPTVQPGQSLAQRLTLAAAAAPFLAVQPGVLPGSLHIEGTAAEQADEAGVVLFTARMLPGYAGAVLAAWPAIQGQAARVSFLSSALTPADSPLPAGFEIVSQLNITYPVDGKNLTWEGVYITGTSDPAQPLLLDGEEVPGRSASGAFGIYVPLEMGANSFTFVNGSTTLVKTITRVAPATGGTPTRTPDATKEVQPGQAVRMNREFVTALADDGNYQSINETFHLGAVAVVKDCKQLNYSSTTLSYVYQLTSGDWVWAVNCDLIEENGQASFTGLRTEPTDKGEWLNFEGSGSPAAYLAYEDATGALVITMYDTQMTLPQGFSSEFVSSASVETIENGIVLTLQTRGIWGYHIDYTQGGTRLFLKRPPALSGNPQRPLEGTHVMLDPGHGESTPDANYGAVGLSGDAGYPHEKDLNLVLAQAIAYRLRQMGAQVTFTKEDDSNPGIYARHAMQTAAQPDFFLSVHHDALDGDRDLQDSATVFGIYYHPYNTPPSKSFAQNLTDSISHATGRRAGDIRWGGGSYGVIRTTICPSVLFEYGLIVNPDHYEGALSTEGIYAAACGTAQAVLTTVQTLGASAAAPSEPPPSTGGTASVPA